MALWRPDVWGMAMRDAGYLHVRSGAAQALLSLGTCAAPANWRRPSSPTLAGSAADGLSAWRCVPPGSRTAGRKAWRLWRYPSLCWANPQRRLSAPGPWSSGVPRCVARVDAAMPSGLFPRASTHPPLRCPAANRLRPRRTAGRWRPSAPGLDHRRRGTDTERAAHRATRARRALEPPDRTRPVTYPSRRSRATSPAPTTSSVSPLAASSTRCSNREKQGCLPSSGTPYGTQIMRR